MRGRSGAVWDVDAQQRQRDRLSSGVVRHVGQSERGRIEGDGCSGCFGDAKSYQDSGRAALCDVFCRRIAYECLGGTGMGLGSYWWAEGAERMRTVRRCSKFQVRQPRLRTEGSLPEETSGMEDLIENEIVRRPLRRRDRRGYFSPLVVAAKAEKKDGAQTATRPQPVSLCRHATTTRRRRRRRRMDDEQSTQTADDG